MTRFRFERELWCLQSNRNVQRYPEISFTKVQRGFTADNGLHVVILDLRAEGYGVHFLATGLKLGISHCPSDAPTVETVLAAAGWRGWVQLGRNVGALLSQKLPVTFETAEP
ncbi:MAG: hypothetical protein ACYDHU_10695, partial [Acidimicrobiales bacterium]